MIVCLFGPTLAGKTTVAREVAAQLGSPLRSCGEAVRAQARALGTSLEDMPDAVHVEVDRETVRWAARHRQCIVEGRFLDAVFAGHHDPIVIEVRATEEERVERGRVRLSGYTIDELRLSDLQDRIFRARVYVGRTSIVPAAVLDTSGRTVVECVSCLRSILSI